MGIISKYKALGKVALDLPFLKGTLNDQSGNANNATAPTGVSWQNIRKVRGLRARGTSGIVVADSVSMRYTKATVMLAVSKGLENVTQRIYNHRSVLGTRVDLYYTAGALTLGTGAGTSTVSYTMNGTERTIGFRMYEDARKPDFFINGLFVGQGNAALAVADLSPNPALTIGNYYSGAEQPTTSPITHVVTFNTTALTNQEMAQLHEELMAEKSFGMEKGINFTYPAPQEKDPTCVLDLDMVTMTSDGKLADLSGNGKTLTPAKGPVSVLYGGFQGGQDVHGSSYFIRSASDSDFFAGTYTFETIVNLRSTSAVAGILGNSAGVAHYCGHNAAGKMFLSFQNGAAAQLTKTGLTTLQLNQEMHLVYVFQVSGSDVIVTFYINGVLDSTETFSGVGFTAAGVMQAIVGSFYVTSTFTNGTVYLARYYKNKAMTAFEVATRYKKYAKLLRFRQSMQNAPMTLADVTAGNILGTDVDVTSGSFKISQDSSGKRWLEAATAGTSIASIISTKAYGTWLFELYKTNGTVSYILFTAAAKGVGKAGAQTGYLLEFTPWNRIQFQKIVAGSVSDIAYTAADYITTPGTYRIAVTRRYNGSFSIYVKGGAYANWTLITMTGGNPVTDTAITTSKYMVFAFSVGDKIRGIYELEGVIDPTINPELIPN